MTGESFTPAARGTASAARVRWDDPFAFAALVLLAYGAVMSPFLILHHFDLSTFIVAGDFFVDAKRTASAIAVGHHSFGYDGQFYYRMAVAPFSFQPVDHGIRFDAPTYRTGRIGYPLLVWMLTAGHPALAPAAMFIVNLLGLGAIGALSVTLVRINGLSRLSPVAIVLWPGFVATLAHDTTEIISEAFLLLAIVLHTRRRFGWFALSGALAALTRETTAVVLLGFLLTDLAAWRGRGRVVAIACGAMLLVPVAIWHEALPLLWHLPGASGAFGQNVGWPMMGLWETLRTDAAQLQGWRGLHRMDLMLRLVALFTTVGIAGFCVAVAARIGPALRSRGVSRPLGAGWLLTTALMSTHGPWIDPVGSCRAFTECWTTGCLVLGAAPAGRVRLLTWLSLSFFLAMFVSVLALVAVQFGVLS